MGPSLGAVSWFPHLKTLTSREAPPQLKLKHDVDLDTLPLVAFNKGVMKGKPGLWIQLQD